MMPYEVSVLKSADQVAAIRESRECAKAEKAEKKYREETPLLAWAGHVIQEEHDPPSPA